MEKIEQNVKEAICQMFDKIPIYNTHSHFGVNMECQEDISLKYIWDKSYCVWANDFPLESERINLFLNQGGHNSYTRFLLSGIEKVYKKSVCKDNLTLLNQAIQQQYQDEEILEKSLRQYCAYTTVLVDNYIEPGCCALSNQLFKSVYRVDMFLHGWNLAKKSRDGAHVYSIENISESITFDAYLNTMEETIKRLKNQNIIVALKLGIAYERALEFSSACYDEAKAAFHNEKADAQQIRKFEDFIVFKIAKIAAEYNLPLQIHTGLGILQGANAIYLQELIASNPKTKFVLFHGNFPWTDDLLGLAHKFQNVYIDLCWLPLISPTVATRFLQEAMDIVGSKRISWGCDTRTLEESVGAVIALKEILVNAFSIAIQAHTMNMQEVEQLLENILYRNAETLYEEEFLVSQ